MGKSQAMYRESVCNSDAFLGLSLAAQCLYFHLGFDCDTIGELAGPVRLARGYGMGQAELEELLEAGYLIETDGRWFVAHYYENNAKPKNAKMETAAANLWKKRPASLAYEGEQFNSKLVSLTLAEQQANLSRELDGNSIGNGTDIGNGIVFPPSSSKETVSGGVGSGGEGNAVRSEPCPRCGMTAIVEYDPLGLMRVDCSDCGFYVFSQDGELV